SMSSRAPGSTWTGRFCAPAPVNAANPMMMATKAARNAGIVDFHSRLGITRLLWLIAVIIGRVWRGNEGPVVMQSFDATDLARALVALPDWPRHQAAAVLDRAHQLGVDPMLVLAGLGPHDRELPYREASRLLGLAH